MGVAEVTWSGEPGEGRLRADLTVVLHILTGASGMPDSHGIM